MKNIIIKMCISSACLAVVCCDTIAMKMTDVQSNANSSLTYKVLDKNSLTDAESLLSKADKLYEEEDQIYKALELVEQAARLGSSEAQGCLGFHYAVDSNDEEAGYYFIHVVDKAAGDNVTMCHFSRLANEQKINMKPIDAETAAEYFKLAAGNDPSDGFMFGLCLANGFGVTQNLEEAARYFKLAADQGSVWAQIRYARCLEIGSGVAKDISQALNYYEQAANSKDFVAKETYLRKAKELNGSAEDLFQYAKFVHDHLDSQGLADSDFFDHVPYFHEKGIDLRQMVADCYKRSADQEFSNAQYHYGLCLEYGFGVEKNLEEAIRYYKLAEANHSSNAKLRLASLAESSSEK